MKISLYDKSRLVDLYINAIRTRTDNTNHLTYADFYTLQTMIKMIIKPSDKNDLLHANEHNQTFYNELFER